jgi:hypothetical protein
MAKKMTLTERLRSTALELRANVRHADENLRAQALVAPTDRLYAGVRQDLERLVGYTKGLATWGRCCPASSTSRPASRYRKWGAVALAAGVGAMFLPPVTAPTVSRAGAKGHDYGAGSVNVVGTEANAELRSLPVFEAVTA